MSTIRFFGTLVIFIGIGAVMYALQSFMYNNINCIDCSKIIMLTAFGLVILVSGIELVRVVKDDE
jgi:hypothetical protein